MKPRYTIHLEVIELDEDGDKVDEATCRTLDIALDDLGLTDTILDRAATFAEAEMMRRVQLLQFSHVEISNTRPEEEALPEEETQ